MIGRLAFFVAVAALVTAAPAEAKRVALIIGNDAYRQLPALQKAVADATGYAEALKAKGFDSVTLKVNLNRSGMDEAIAGFVDTIEPGDVAVFAYSGHGWSDGTQNFMLPVDAPEGGSAEYLARVSTPLKNGNDGVLDDMDRKGASLKVAIVDACRDNPFKAVTTSKGFNRLTGLVRIEPPRGTFVIFSAAAGQSSLDRLAYDDRDPNSVFTRIFLPVLKANVSLQEAVKKTQAKVVELAKSVSHDQRPAYYDEVVGEACLGEKCGVEVAALPPATTVPTPVAQTPAGSVPPVVAITPLVSVVHEIVRTEVTPLNEVGARFPAGRPLAVYAEPSRVGTSIATLTGDAMRLGGYVVKDGEVWAYIAEGLSNFGKVSGFIPGASVALGVGGSGSRFDNYVLQTQTPPVQKIRPQTLQPAGDYRSAISVIDNAIEGIDSYDLYNDTCSFGSDKTIVLTQVEDGDELLVIDYLLATDFSRTQISVRKATFVKNISSSVWGKLKIYTFSNGSTAALSSTQLITSLKLSKNFAHLDNINESVLARCSERQTEAAVEELRRRRGLAQDALSSLMKSADPVEPAIDANLTSGLGHTVVEIAR